MSPLEQVLRLLSVERAAEQESYRQLIEQSTVHERIKKGVCWAPIVVQRTGWGLGEHPFLVVERTKLIDQDHQFKSGQVVHFFVQVGDKAAQDEVTRGIINWVDKTRMKVTLYGTELPDWLSKGRVGVQLDFDERSYTEMERAVRTVMSAKGNRLAELRDIFYGKRAPVFDNTLPPLHTAHLNDSQNAAIN